METVRVPVVLAGEALRGKRLQSQTHDAEKWHTEERLNICAQRERKRANRFE